MVSGDGCTPDCKKESAVDQCVAKLGTDDRPACARCNCEKCEKLTLDCYAPGNADDAKLCGDLVRCGLDKGCASDSCYCGTSIFTTCVLGIANGMCRTQV